jgi:hypothetical protein
MAGFSTVTRKEARQKLGLTDDQVYVVSFGGSLGAETVNDAVLDMMKQLSGRYPHLVCLHAAGKRDYSRMKNTFDGLCVEMEGTAIAHTAWVNQIPFVIVRFISDKANEKSSKTYEQIEDEAANHSASIIKDALMHLA